MFPYELYKVLHLLGILALFAALGGSVLLFIAGKADELRSVRKFLAMIQGVALLVIFVAGFGLMARLNMMGASWPLWIYVKVAVWLLLGASLVLIRRVQTIGRWWYVLLPLVGAVAAYMAIYKPT